MLSYSISNQNCPQFCSTTAKKNLNRQIEQSEVLFKRNQIVEMIRIRDRKQKRWEIRNQMCAVGFIEQQLNFVPNTRDDSERWARSLIEKYKSTKKYVFTSNQLIDIFKIIYTFPNQSTLQLFEIIVLKANQNQLNDLFQQYDIINFLHSFITFSCSMIPFNNIVNDRQASFNQDKDVNGVGQVFMSINNSQTQCRLTISKTVINILAQLCRKDQQIRNFAILIHKSLYYCLCVYKYFKKDVQPQFINFLQGATVHTFNQYSDQYVKITKMILLLFYKHQMEINMQIILQENGRNILKMYQYLVSAVNNLLKMHFFYINKMIFAERREQHPQILYKIKNLLAGCNRVLQNPAIQQHPKDMLPDNLMKEVITLSKHFFESFSSSKKIDKLPICLELINFLMFGKSQDIDSQPFLIARRRAYFLHQNSLSDASGQQRLTSIIFFGGENVMENRQKQNLLILALKWLKVENNENNVLNLLQLINSILLNVPKDITKPFIISAVNIYIADMILIVLIHQLNNQSGDQCQ